MGGSRPRSRPPQDAVAVGTPRSPARSVRRHWCTLPRYAWHSSALTGYVGWVFWTRRGPFALRAHRAPPRGRFPALALPRLAAPRLVAELVLLPRAPPVTRVPLVALRAPRPLGASRKQRAPLGLRESGRGVPPHPSFY